VASEILLMMTELKPLRALAGWARPRRWITGGVLVAVAVAGYFLVQAQPKVITSDSGIKVLVAGQDYGGMDARIEGRLTDVNGCLGLHVGSREVLVVWPHGTSALSGSSLRVRFPNDSVAALGDLINGGGGFIERAPYPSSVPTLPAECAAGTFFLLDIVKLSD